MKDNYGYLEGLPDEGVYYKTADLLGRPIIVAAERLGETAQVACYQDGVFVGGMCPVDWERAKAIALNQFEECERARQRLEGLRGEDGER